MANRQQVKQKGGWMVWLLIALIIVAGLVIPSPGEKSAATVVSLQIAWLVVALLMLVTMAVIGVSLGKGISSILIDPERNMMSLSRLQIVLWTLVILSAFVTVGLARVRYSLSDATPAVEEPLAIQLPQLVWALMGVSITSAVGSPLLKAAKAQRTEAQEQQQEQEVTIRKQQGEPAQAATYHNALEKRTRYDAEAQKTYQNTGALVKKNSWEMAKFSDVFMGEEVTNFMYVDVVKVQNFFFTVVAVVVYTMALASEIAKGAALTATFGFPDPMPGLVAMISISHAGYLTDKAFTHATPEKPGK
jgi:hypothetical protein